MSKFSPALFAALVMLGALAQPAHAERGADHPEVSRYPGAVIEGYDFKEYEEAQLILSRPAYRGGEFTADKVLPLEGRVTYIHYEMPKTASALQVFRNYQSALKRSGFSELFVCDRPCTDANLSSFKALMKARNLYLNGSRENQYLAAKRGNTYVSLWVNDLGEPNAWLFVIEKGSLDDNQMAISGESAIAKSLSEQGRVDLYGFQFDTGKAVLRDSSQATLKELGKVLQDNPTLQIEVIGHTDDAGGADANQRLSEARARAVTEALARNGIDASRMLARGMGQTQPLAANTDETGRAKNRRVEIIAQRPAATAATQAQASRPAPRPQAQTAPANGNSNESNKSAADTTRSVIDSATTAIDTAYKLKGLLGL
ncbi:OmpA family protein [Niveibacterium sp.]|uniref:OmpA family protein n=1 Tax=Niveibacterium sp. TaxID=2017444 RepID=UPI0035AFC33C